MTVSRWSWLLGVICVVSAAVVGCRVFASDKPDSAGFNVRTKPLLKDGVALAPGGSSFEAIADWVIYAGSVSDIAKMSSSIWRGVVIDVANGRRLPDSTRNKTKDATGVPTTMITLQITDFIKGERPDVAKVRVTGDNKFWSRTDPPYRIGDEYIFGTMPKKILGKEARGSDEEYFVVLPGSRILVRGNTAGTFEDNGVRRDLKAYPKSGQVTALLNELRNGQLAAAFSGKEICLGLGGWLVVAFKAICEA